VNNLAYNSQQPDKVGPQVEEKVRKETGATAPVPYKVEDQAASKTSAATVLGDMANALVGGRSNLLFTLVFDMPAPRPATLRAQVARQGVGSHVEGLLYSMTLAKAVKGEVSLENPKMLGSSRFTGDAEAIQKLNANGDLVKRANKFARTQSEVGGLTVSMDRLFKIVPQDSGALLLINTLPRTTSMGMDAALDAKEFFDIAALVEKTL
jgi:hypothetical protein